MAVINLRDLNFSLILNKVLLYLPAPPKLGLVMTKLG